MKICNECKLEKMLDDFPTQMKREKLVHLGNCRDCHNAKQRQNYLANHEQRKQKLRDYHELNREAMNEQSRIYYLNNKDKAQAYYQENKEELAKKDWARGIYRRYGLTVEEYNNLSEQQNHVCVICQKSANAANSDKLHIDHCHVTGKVRGLLCTNCNNALGRAKEDPRILRAAAEYIESFM